MFFFLFLKRIVSLTFKHAKIRAVSCFYFEEHAHGNTNGVQVASSLSLRNSSVEESNVARCILKYSSDTISIVALPICKNVRFRGAGVRHFGENGERNCLRNVQSYRRLQLYPAGRVFYHREPTGAFGRDGRLTSSCLLSCHCCCCCCRDS